MKRLFTLFLLAGTVLVLTQCKKENKPTATSIKNMSELNVPANFDWKMSRPVTFHIKGAPNEVIIVKTADGSQTIYKATIPAGGTVWQFKMMLPFLITQVKINESLINITGTEIYYSLPKIKQVLLTNYDLVFDGTDDYVDLGDITQLNNAAAVTIEGWANQTVNTNSEYIFSKADGFDNDIRIRTSGGSFIIDWGNGSDAYATWSGYSTTISSATWFHWAVVFDGSGLANADRLKLYIDGSITPIVIVFTGTIPATTSSSLSGDNAYLSSAFTPFGGKMDEVRIWSVARTGTQINDYYDKLVSGATANLVANWRMNEGTGTTLYDETSNDWDGTISGSTWFQELSGFDSDGDGALDDTDDYEFDATRAFDNFYPATDYGTLACEDLWPWYGDYDFNDLILGYRFKTVTNASNEVVEIFATFIVRANGAGLHNGFGFELPDAESTIASNIVVTGYSHNHGLVTINGTSHLETGQTNPVIIAFDDTYDLMPGIFNTIPGNATAAIDSVVITINVTGGGPYDEGDFSLGTWNPFLFIDATRGREVHQLDYPPTDLMNITYFGMGSDASIPASDIYYQTSNHLPWMLDFPTNFKYASEYNDINTAYLHFSEWAESGGTTYTDWYSNTGAGYRNTANIYP